METDRDFEKLTVHELIADDSFMQWVKQPDEQLNTYWLSVMTTHPHAKKTMEEARRLVQQMYFEEHMPKPGRKQLVFDRIKEAAGIEAQPAVKEKPGRTIQIRKYLQIAAAVLLVVASGVWFYTRYGTKSTGGLSTDEIMVSANKGLLFLSNGEIVNLKDLQVGTIVEKGALRFTMPEPKHLVFQGNKTTETIGVDSMLSPMGQVWQLELPDKSKVWLNSGSTIRLAGMPAGRRGADISGQAYFEVSYHNNIPFVVQLNDVGINILSTEFDVVNDPDGLAEVALVEGRVQVKREKGNVHQLAIGEKATYNVGKIEPKIVKVDLKYVAAWKEGIFAFDKMDIDEVMRPISRWYGLKVIYHGPKPKARISGTIPHESSLQEVLDILQDIGADARFEVASDKIIVTSAGTPSAETKE